MAEPAEPKIYSLTVWKLAEQLQVAERFLQREPFPAANVMQPGVSELGFGFSR